MADARLRRGMVNSHPLMTPKASNLKVPYVDPALIEHLQTSFKPLVRADFTLRDYDRQCGQQQVIEHLQNLYDQQDGG